MRRTILAMLAMGLVASMAPMSAQANHCNRQIVIFPSPVGLNSNVAACLADEGEDIDGRIIYPGSTGFSGRYTEDLGEGVPVLWVHLTGTFTAPGGQVTVLDTRQKMTRQFDSTLGFWSYNLGSQTMPGGRTVTGCLTADVELPDEDPEDVLDETTYRHIGATC